MWWVDPGWMSDAYQSHLIIPHPQLDREGERHVGQDKEITQQLPLWAKQTQNGENSLTYYRLIRGR